MESGLRGLGGKCVAQGKKKADLADVCKVEQICWGGKLEKGKNPCSDVPLTSATCCSKAVMQAHRSGTA